MFLVNLFFIDNSILEYWKSSERAFIYKKR